MTYKVAADMGYVKYLAALLAKENISVVVDTAMTAPAAFDLKSRTLFMSERYEDKELTPGFTVHEVGHALFTNLTSRQIKDVQSYFTIFNIVEDGYIERRMCHKYPGVKKYLQKYFDKLFVGRDSRGDTLVGSICNVLNHNCKGIKYANVLDYPIEMDPLDVMYFKQAEMLNKHDIKDRLAVAFNIYEILKKYGSVQSPPPMGGKGGDESEDGGGGSADSEDAEKKESEETTAPSGASGGENEDDEEASSDPEEILQNDKNFFDHHKEMGEELDFPDLDAVPTVISEDGLAKFAHHYDIKSLTTARYQDTKAPKLKDQRYKDCIGEARKAANRIYGTFMVRKSASNRANTKDVNSGDLDIAKIPYYKIDDDIFQIQKIRPNQQNHAYSIGIDWSASMVTQMRCVFSRAAEIALFCRKAKISCDIFLYTDGATRGHFTEATGITSFSKFIQVLNSLDPDFDSRMRKFWELCYGGAARDAYQLHGTNVVEGFMYAHHKLKKRREHIKKAFVLTDGADTVQWTAKVKSGGTVEYSRSTPSVYFRQKKIDSTHHKIRYDVMSYAAKYYKEVYNQDTYTITWNMNDDGFYADVFDNMIRMHQSDPSDDKYRFVNAPNEVLDEIIRGLL